VTIVARKLAVIGVVILLLDVVAAAGWAASRSSHSSVAATEKFSTRDANAEITDALSWRILRSYVSHQIKNGYVPVTAKGIYVVMDVAATNNATHVVTLSGGSIKLDLGGVKYALAAGGLQGLELAGRKPLPGATLAPAATTSGWVAFDVPVAAVPSVPELCLGEATCLPAPSV